MSDSISRLSVVVEEKGIESTLRGLDKLILMMEKADTRTGSPITVRVDSSQAKIAADQQEKADAKSAASREKLTAFIDKEEARTTEISKREAAKRLTVAENEAAKQATIVVKNKSEQNRIVAEYEKKREAYSAKIHDDIAKSNTATQNAILQSNATTWNKIEEIERTSAARTKAVREKAEVETTAIQQREAAKRVTESQRIADKISVESAKNASKLEQISLKSEAQINSIRERTVSFAEKMHLREQAAAERNLKAQQQGFVSLADVAGKAQQILAIGFAGYGVAELTLGLIKAADSMTEMNSRLKLVTSTSAELKKVQEELYRTSQASGTSIKNNADIYFGLARSTKTLGTSQADLIKLTDGLGKAAIVSGASTESYKSAMIQLRQALESGVFRGQEFNSVMEQAPRIAQALAQGLGKTTGELRKMAGEGKLTTDVVIPALLQGLKKVDEEYAQMPRTVSRGWETISNAFLSWVDKANKASGATNDLSSALFGIAQAMDSVSGEALISTMNKLILAGEIIAGVYAGKVVQAFIASSTAAYQGVKADIAKVNSEASTTAAAMRTAEANAVAAKSSLDRANVAVAAAEREVVANNAALMGTVRATAAREALAIAMVTQARAADVASKAEAELAITTNAATVAQERQAAAGTASAVAMGKLGTVFSAMGGWVTVAIAAIWGLVTVWDKVANAAENAAKAQKDAIRTAKAAESRAEVTKLYSEAQGKATMFAQSATAAQSELDSMSKSDLGRKRQQEIVDNFKEQARNWQNTANQLELVGKQKTETLVQQVQAGLSSTKTPEDIAKSFEEGAKNLSQADQLKKKLDEINSREASALKSIRASISAEDIARGITTPDSITKAEKRIKDSAERERRVARSKTGTAGGAKRPEISAGLDAGLIFSKEQLELITKLSSAQEKLLGYITPETLAQKQKLEVMVEQENVASKVAKIQEQLTKKNLTPQAKKELQDVLATYTKRKDTISDELIITQLLQREQNNLKKYQEEVLKPAQQRNEIERATLDVAFQTGQISAEEAQRQASLNSLKLLEVEYAGQVAEAERTLNELQEKGYTDAAKNAQTRLDNLVRERDAKLKIAQIKIDGAEQAKSFEAGFGRAWQKYKDDAADASKFTEKLLTDVLKGIEDALYNMMNGMKLSFSDLWKTVLSDVKRYLAQQMTKEIGDSIKGLLSGTAGGNSSGGLLSGLFGGSSNAGGAAGGSAGILGAVGATIKSYGTDLISSFGEMIGSSSLQNIAGGVNLANPSFVGPIQPGADMAGSASGIGGTLLAGAGAAFNLFNSIKTGKGWGSTIGSMAGLIPGIGPLAGIAGTLIGGLVDSTFGSKGGPKTGGNYNAAFTATGGVVAENMFGGYTPSELDKQMQTSVKDFQKNYTDLVKSLGGVAKDLTINLGGDLDPQGSAGNRVSAQVAIGSVGTGTSDSGAAERALWDASLYSTISKSVSGDFDAAVKLETSRMLVAALKASDLPADVAKVFSGIDLSNLTQEQIDSLLMQAQTASEAFKTTVEEVAKAATDLTGILALFDKWKYVFPNFVKASDDAKKAFTDLSGGLDALASKMASYYENFYSDAEKTSMAWKNISDVLTGAGVKVIPKTREEFRKLMESADIGTESGKKLADALFSIQDQFASVTTSLDDVAKAADDAKKATEDKLKADRDAAIKAAQDALEEARRKVQEAYDRESDALRTTIDRLTQFQDQIRKFRDSLYLDKTLSPLSNYDKYQFAKSRLEEIQQKALMGDEKALEELEQASRDFLEYSRVYNANNLQYQRDFDAVQAFLNKVQINTKTQIDLAKQQLANLDLMVEGILTVNNSVMSLAAAIAAYQAALVALLAAQGGGGGSTPVPSTPTPTTPIPPTGGTGGTTGGTGGTTGGTGGYGPSHDAPLPGYEQTAAYAGMAVSSLFGRSATQRELNWIAEPLGKTASYDQVLASVYSSASGQDLDYLKSVRQGWIASGYQTLFGRQADQSEKDWWYSQLGYSTTSNKVYDMLAAGATGSDLDYLKANLPWMVPDGSHANGLSYVPFDNYRAELHQGERVLTAYENRAYMSTSAGGFSESVVQPLLRELAQTRKELAELKAEVARQGDADRQQRGAIAEAQISVQQKQMVEQMRQTAANV